MLPFPATRAPPVFGDQEANRCRRTAIVAGAPLLFLGARPGLDGVPYLIDTATHEYSKSGFFTNISAKLYDGSSGGGGGSGEGEGAGKAGSGPDGKVSPDSPPGTPATPSGWTGVRRSGLTDAN